jgi:molecular chaperone DnaK
MLCNGLGEILTPSVVVYAEDDVIVGSRAKQIAEVAVGDAAECVKREMGKKAYSKPIHGKRLPPEVIQACILRQLRSDIVQVLGSEFQAVVTVPAYFDEPRRQATADAAEMAGLELLDIVNEPTAAALAFGEHAGYLTAGERQRAPMTVLVYDLGGGTFDATVIRLEPGHVRALATDGDVLLGGRDWDQRLGDHMAEQFCRQHGEDPREHSGSHVRLLHLAEEAKHRLSIRPQTDVAVEHHGHRADVHLTRSLFEELTEDLLHRTSYTTRQVLAAAGSKWDDIDRILLVGGSTRMPMVARMLEDLSGLTPDRTVNPDEAVARGAALYANYLVSVQQADSEGPAYDVVNVNSHSLGVEAVNRHTNRRQNVILIPRNTPLPTSRTRRCATKLVGQRSILIKVLEGESSTPKHCTTIGEVVLHELPANLPRRYPVDITYHYAANGRLHVKAHLPDTDCAVDVEFRRDTGVSPKGIRQWKKAVTSQRGFDVFDEVLQDVLEEEMS